MTAYDSIERGAADECKPLTGRRPRTFTLTHLLVACGAVCVCAIGATMVVNTHLANTHEDSTLANFDLGSAVDDDSAHANFDDDYPGGAQLGYARRSPRRSSRRSHRYKCSKDWVDDSLCAASPPRLSESKNRGRALLGNCAKRPKSSDSVSCNGHGWCHEGTTASGNKPHCNCDAGYGGSHCETKILNLEELSIKVADIDEELEKKAESVDQG